MSVKSISFFFENNAGVIENVKGDKGFGDHTSGSRASRMRQTAVLRTQQNSSG